MSIQKSKHSHSSQVSEGSTLDLKQQDILKQSSSLNTTPTANTYSKDIGQMSLFGEMLKPLTQTVAEKSTASLGATHVSHSPLPGSKKARKMTATSGRECLKLLNTKDPLSSFARTCLVTLSWASMKCYLTWKVKATPRGRLLFQLQQSMPTIKESVSGLWPTPDASARGARRNQNGHQVTLQDAVAGHTPEARAYMKKQMWPTPNAWDGNRGPRSQKNLREKNHQINLITAVKDADSYKKTGALNADWVEWLMGFPRGWTNLTSQELQQIKQGGCKD